MQEEISPEGEVEREQTWEGSCWDERELFTRYDRCRWIGRFGAGQAKKFSWLPFSHYNIRQRHLLREGTRRGDAR